MVHPNYLSDTYSSIKRIYNYEIFNELLFIFLKDNKDIMEDINETLKIDNYKTITETLGSLNFDETKKLE
jgi:hypothetical protein